MTCEAWQIGRALSALRTHCLERWANPSKRQDELVQRHLTTCLEELPSAVIDFINAVAYTEWEITIAAQCCVPETAFFCSVKFPKPYRETLQYKERVLKRTWLSLVQHFKTFFLLCIVVVDVDNWNSHVLQDWNNLTMDEYSQYKMLLKQLKLWKH